MHSSPHVRINMHTCLRCAMCMCNCALIHFCRFLLFEVLFAPQGRCILCLWGARCSGALGLRRAWCDLLVGLSISPLDVLSAPFGRCFGSIFLKTGLPNGRSRLRARLSHQLLQKASVSHCGVESCHGDLTVGWSVLGCSPQAVAGRRGLCQPEPVRPSFASGGRPPHSNACVDTEPIP